MAEIMNAQDFLPTVKQIFDMNGNGETIELQGVWRLWPEHGSDETYRLYRIYP